MRPRWPDDTVFQRLELDVERAECELCGHVLHVCDHRLHRIHTLQGPVEIVARLAHCSDRACPERSQTISPAAELSLTLPWWTIGWDVFSWMGHRRFARHWDIPQLLAELRETYHIDLSKDTVDNYLRRYQNMLTARQQDPLQLAEVYRGIKSLTLSIDGLQPEKGHETLYVVRELNAKRVWFAEALLSSSAAEVLRLVVRVHEWVERRGLPVKLWLSDKQKAFLTGIATEFSGVPHRYCQNHFLRDLAKPTLAKDSSAKVQMRSKVRGLREIEREVLDQRRERQAAEQQQGKTQSEAKQDVASTSASAEADGAGTEQETALAPMAPGADSEANQGAGPTPEPEQAAAAPLPNGPAKPAFVDKDSDEEVVLAYCAVARGILNDDQGGPLHPPGLRMAEALDEVRASIQRNLDEKKGGFAEKQLSRLADCIDRGLDEVRDEQETIREHVKDIKEVAATLETGRATCAARQEKFEEL